MTVASLTPARERSSVHPFNTKPPGPQNHFPFHHPCIHLSARVSFLLDELISLPLPRCLSDPRDPGESPNRLLLPIRIDRPPAPCQGRSIRHSFSNDAPPRSLATSSFAASLYFHFIISQSRSMQANRPTVNHTAIRPSCGVFNSSQ